VGEVDCGLEMMGKVLMVAEGWWMAGTGGKSTEDLWVSRRWNWCPVMG
jgi:hypothetical protein